MSRFGSFLALLILVGVVGSMASSNDRGAPLMAGIFAFVGLPLLVELLRGTAGRD